MEHEDNNDFNKNRIAWNGPKGSGKKLGGTGDQRKN